MTREQLDNLAREVGITDAELGEARAMSEDYQTLQRWAATARAILVALVERQGGSVTFTTDELDQAIKTYGSYHTRADSEGTLTLYLRAKN
jgi:hypothetical protein